MARFDGFLTSIASNSRVAFLCGCAVIATGLGGGGLALASGLVKMRRADREVTVRGVAQREVTANRATWNVVYSEKAYSLPEALAAEDRDSETIRAFLAARGFAGRVTQPGSANVSVTDELVDDKPTGRRVYTVGRSIAFVTDDVAGVEKVEAEKDELAQKGLVVDSVNASYEYTQLDRIKPDMIAEATRDARRAAEKFASDSGASVGGIRSATQGYFSVTSRDAAGDDSDEGGSSSSASSPDQRVRVVTTIDYYLD
jgi:hypothetical protein